MKLIAGLGNPGSRYERTRHNAGFLAADVLCERYRFNLKPSKGDWYEGIFKHRGEEVLVIKPTTYMNGSGIAVRESMTANRIGMNDLLVIVDDFQIPLGTLRLRPKGSDGGHNGIASIIYELESDEFARLRIGIGNDSVIRKDDFVDYVLGDFTEEELKKFEKISSKIGDCVESFVEYGPSKTMNSFNRNFLEETESNKKDKKDN